MKTNTTALRSRYGKTDISEELLRYPFDAPIKYDFDYTGTYSKFSIVDKYYVDTLVKPHKRLISGGVEWSNFGGSMTFSHSDIYYTFTGKVMGISASTSLPILTFENGTSNPRIDAVVINEGGELGIVKGMAATPPPRPTISESQILLQYAYIDTSATTLGVSEQVYTNNSQWTVTPYQLSGLNSGNFNAAFSGDDYASGFCVQVDSDYRTGVKFTKPAGSLTATDYGSLSMRIKFTSVVPDDKSLFAQIQGTANGASVYSNTVNLMTYGLQREIVGTWQHVLVPTSKFGQDMSQYNVLTLRMSGGQSNINTLWRVDQILFQRGWSFDGYMGEPDGTGGGGSSTAVTGVVIGPAESGDDTYLDGVFTDFNPLTPIGTAVDRFNELFLSLVPSPAPLLSKWSGARTGGVPGKLSFGTNQTIDASTYFAATLANGALSAAAVDTLWTNSLPTRLLIFSANNANDLSGTLAFGESADPGVPFPAYAASSFREAKLGTLTLTVNGVIVSTASLATNSSINNTSGNSVSGFVLSSPTQSRFPGGKYFETDNPLFTSRTGQWLVKNNDAALRNGYNYIIAEHKSTTTNVFTRTLTRFEFMRDANTTATSYSGFSITSFALTGENYLSGLKYFTGGQINYDGTISNLYRNTFNPDSDAISFVDVSASGTGLTTPILNLAGTAKSILNSADDETRNVVLSVDYNSANPLAFTILPTGKRRINDEIRFHTVTKRTVQGTTIGGTVSITGIYLDNVVSTSNNSTAENFDDERFRLKGETAGLSYSLISNITTGGLSSGTWSGTFSLIGTDAHHNTGLQVINSGLVYPKTNFSTHGTLATNANFGNSDYDYSTATGARTYIRYFYNATTFGNFKIRLNGSNGTPVAKSTALTGNNIWLEMKLPGTATRTTGWMDCYLDFNQVTATSTNFGDGIGCRKGSSGAGRALNADWGLTTGDRNNSTSGGYVVIKITTSSSFVGPITDIVFTWG